MKIINNIDFPRIEMGSPVKIVRQYVDVLLYSTMKEQNISRNSSQEIKLKEYQNQILLQANTI